MRTKIIPIVPILILFSVFFFSCEDTTYKEYTGYAPVYLSYGDLRSAVTVKSTEELKNPGKNLF